MQKTLYLSCVKATKFICFGFIVTSLVFMLLALKKHLNYKDVISSFKVNSNAIDAEGYGVVIDNVNLILGMKNNFLLLAATSLVIGISLLLYIKTQLN